MRDVFLVMDTNGKVVDKQPTTKAAIEVAKREAKCAGGGV